MRTRSRKQKGETPQHDRGYKLLFSHPTAVEELLRGFLQEDWSERLDFSTLERVGNSFVSEDLRERHGDLIWRLRVRGEADGWFYLYLLLEFQSTSDPFMALRLLTYVSLLLEEILRQEKLKPGDRLPAVLPLVLHNGKRPWRAPCDLGSLLVEVPTGLQRYLPQFRYLLLDVGRLDLDRSDLAQNPIASVLRLDASGAGEDFLLLTRKFADLLSRIDDPELCRILRSWWISLAQRTFPGVIISETLDLTEAPMLEESAKRWSRQLLQKGRQEGKQQGRQEGMIDGTREMLLQQIKLRFGRVPRTVRQRIDEISSVRELRALGRKVVLAETLQDLGLC